MTVPKFKVGDIAVFLDGFPGPYPYVGVVEAITGDQLTFRDLDIKKSYTRAITDFSEPDEDDKRRAAKLLSANSTSEK